MILICNKCFWLLGSTACSIFPKDQTSEKVLHKIYQVPFTTDFFDALLRLEIEGRKLELFMKKSTILSDLCESALVRKEVLNGVRGSDLLVYAGGIYCGPLVGEFLGIPRVEIFPYPLNILLDVYHGTPMPVSYFPQLLTDLTDKMTFVERVTNLFAYLGGKLVFSFLFDRTMNKLKLKFNITPERSFQEAVGDTELVIITADFALEYPLPLLPGVTCKNCCTAKSWFTRATQTQTQVQTHTQTPTQAKAETQTELQGQTRTQTKTQTQTQTRTRAEAET